MSTASVKYVHLEPNPKSVYKQLFLKGTRIPARAIYGWYAGEEPMTVEEIAADYNVPIAAVREAVAYCELEPPELREDYARQAASMDAMGLNDKDYDGQPKPLTGEQRAKLRAKLRAP